MNFLFITLSQFESFNDDTIYTGWMRMLLRKGHHVDAISPLERKYCKESKLYVDENGNRVLNLKVGNIQKCNKIEKGISTLTIEGKLVRGVKKFFSDVKYDMVIFSTPPITFEKVVRYVKRRDNAVSYLMLKDIFPQNAVDIGMMKDGSFIYKYFRKKEKSMYNAADYIGCMSPANVNYIIKHNSEIDALRVEVCPNALEPKIYIDYDKNALKEQYDLPVDKRIFMYGGNLGKPQNVDFILEVLKKNADKKDRFFIVCGTGTDAWKLQEYFEQSKQTNLRYISGLPKDEYDRIIKACDVGMIFLDYRFTIPNYPSRLLSYMENKMPVVAFTDVNTDIGEVLTQNQFGWWAESNNAEACTAKLDEICACSTDILKKMGDIAYEYMFDNYNVNKINVLEERCSHEKV